MQKAISAFKYAEHCGLPEFESVDSFAKRVNLPAGFIRALAKQGVLPCLKPGSRNIHICVSSAVEFLRKYAGQNANNIAMVMPVPVKVLSDNVVKIPEMDVTKRRKGRIPDKVKARMKEGIS
ncbi:hypothetical protein [Pectinatus frisingensis]|uniref:hypothetical protein n=1 Tax=Pectinatus frisingensis TaxID=865 RepID=UPI001E346BCD|nr:hypothetical protein [Pectinatus frisingensis]